MQDNTSGTGIPVLSAPVERALNTTAATAAEGVDQSVFAGITWKDIPFADEGDE